MIHSTVCLLISINPTGVVNVQHLIDESMLRTIFSTPSDFTISEQIFLDRLSSIAKRYDVTCITEKQKTAMSKELFDMQFINAIEHAILSLPCQTIKDSLAMQADLQTPINLIDIYLHKASLHLNDASLCPEKILNKKFLFIMLHMQNVHHENAS